MRKILKLATLAVTAILFGTVATKASAQQYPNKPIKLVISFPPAGATDVLGRAIGQKLSESLGQPVVIENRPGAGGTIGSDVVAKASPDGYTLLLASGGICIAANMYSKLSFDPVKSFTPVSIVGYVPHMLVANPSVPANSINELIALAKAKPGHLNAASQGNGTLSHMELELLKGSAGINLTHVPYKGSSNAMNDLLAGHVSVLFDSVTSSLPMVRKGQLKALGVVSPKRLPFAPDIPTIAEAGLPGFDASNWFAILAPAGTPADVVQTLNAHLVKVLAMPDLRERLAPQGAILESSTPEQLLALIKGDLVRWEKVVKQSGVRME
jgi:tripartite-type tricarboxylate transporter receptor subunit TctC